MRKLIDLPDDIAKSLKKKAVDADKDFKNFIQDRLINMAGENETLTQVQSILQLGYSEFCNRFPASQIAAGDRSVDYALHFVKLDHGLYLLVSFVEFSVDSFSIIEGGHLDTIKERYEELFF